MLGFWRGSGRVLHPESRFQLSRRCGHVSVAQPLETVASASRACLQQVLGRILLVTEERAASSSCCVEQRLPFHSVGKTRRACVHSFDPVDYISGNSAWIQNIAVFASRLSARGSRALPSFAPPIVG
jgi:hypothetical protein